MDSAMFLVKKRRCEKNCVQHRGMTIHEERNLEERTEKHSRGGHAAVVMSEHPLYALTMCALQSYEKIPMSVNRPSENDSEQNLVVVLAQRRSCSRCCC